jgi:hypothetical protein
MIMAAYRTPVDPRTWLVRTVTGAALVLATAACTGDSPSKPAAPRRPSLSVEWTTVALPAGQPLPRTLARDGDRILVAGEIRNRTTHSPGAWIVTSPQVVSTLALRPHSGYGPTANLVAAALHGDTVTLLGQRSGGAHSIPRWTVWVGMANAGVDDQPQTFETFGGGDSLGLTGAASIAGRPLLVGNWEQDDGFPGPALWRPEGSKWIRLPAGNGLRSDAGRQNLATALGALGDRPVVLGQSVPLRSRTPTVIPTLWLGSPRSTDRPNWTATGLGGRSALDLDCAATTCLAATRATTNTGDGIALWRVDARGHVSKLPTPAGTKGSTWAQVAVDPGEGLTVAFGPEGGRSMLSRWNPATHSWRSATGTAARIRDLTVTPTTMFAITGDGQAEDAPRELVAAPRLP